MHYLREDTTTLDNFIDAEQPDVIAIQEWSGWEATHLKSKPNWHIHGTPRLFLASRHPIRQVVDLGHNSMGKHASAARYELDTPFGTVHVVSLHTATNRMGISDTVHANRKGPSEVQANSNTRREQSEYVARQAAQLHGPVLIMGDFNTPPESVIFSQVWSGYPDAFNTAGWGWGYTFMGSETRVRIDHILTGRGWKITDCRVGPFVGPLHRPVIADLVWTE